MHPRSKPCFRKVVATTLIWLQSAGCATFPDDDDALCPALNEVASQVGVGETASVKVFLGSDDPNAIFPITCQHDGDMRWHRVCPTLIDRTSHEFSGIFAYQIKSCVARHGRIGHVETAGVEDALAHTPPRLLEVDGRISGVVLRMRELRDHSGYEVSLSK